MKKILLMLILIPSLVWANDISTLGGKSIDDIASIMGKAKDDIATVGGGSVPAASSHPADVTFWLNFEANDTTGDYNMNATNEYSAGDTSGAYNDSALEGGSVVANSGTYSLFVDGGNQNMGFALSGNDILATNFRIAIWFETTAVVNYDVLLAANGPTEEMFDIELSGTDEIVVRYRWLDGNTCTYTTTDANIVNGTTACIEVKVDIVGNDITIYKDGVELSDGGKSCSDSTTMLGVTNWNSLTVGGGQNSSTDFNVGKVVISNDKTRTIYTTWNETVNYP